MTELEINRMMYENLIMARVIGFSSLFLIICIVCWEIYGFLQTRPHETKKKKPFFYAGTFDDFVKEERKKNKQQKGILNERRGSKKII